MEVTLGHGGGIPREAWDRRSSTFFHTEEEGRGSLASGGGRSSGSAVWLAIQEAKVEGFSCSIIYSTTYSFSGHQTRPAGRVW